MQIDDTSEDAKHRKEWKEYQKANPGIKFAWAGPYDDQSCAYCKKAMDNSPYEDPEKMPEPGAGECAAECRHMIILIEDQLPPKGTK